MSLFSDETLIKLSETSSTNDYLENLIKEEQLVAGTVVISKSQPQGKGMDQNKWESETGKNLTFSILIRPTNISPTDQYLISICTSLAVSDFISTFNIKDVKIKWPNDIYVDDKKICGILIRHSIEGNKIGHSVIGIGININQEKFSSWIPNPVSVKNICKQETRLPRALHNFLAIFENRYLQMTEGNIEEMHKEYLKLMYRRNQFAEYRFLGERITAKITGLGEFGFLQFEDLNGKMYECDLKEIEYIL